MKFANCCLLTLFLLTGCAKHSSAPDYGFSSSENNAYTYDYKLGSLEKKDGFLWPIAVFPDTSINRMRDMTTRDYLRAVNLSYSLKTLPKTDHSHILPLLNRSMLNFTIGDYYHSFRYLIRAKDVMDSLRQEGGIIGTEQTKIFKGEVYEQSLAALYLGFLFYDKQDYQNARAMFTQAVELDRETIPDDVDEAANFGILGNDNRLAYYMLARTYAKLSDKSNSEVSLKNSNNWQAVPEKTRDDSVSEGRFLPYSNGMPIQPVKFDYSEYDPDIDITNQPNPYNHPENLRNDNLVLLIGLGSSPKKVLGSVNFIRDYIAPTPYLERSAKIYVDDRLFAESYPMYNHFHQAASLHRSDKDTMQTGKAVIKGVITIAAAFVSSDLSRAVDNSWNVAADGRYWGTVPNEIHLASGYVKPGLHTIKIEFFDKDHNPLPHYRQILHYVPVSEDDETLLHIRAIRDRYNTKQLIEASRIKSIDHEKKIISFNVKDFKGLQVGDEMHVITLGFDSPRLMNQYWQEQVVFEDQKLREQQSLFGVEPKFLVNNLSNVYDATYQELVINKVSTIKIQELTSSTVEAVYKGDLDPEKVYLVTKSHIDQEKVSK